VKTLRSVRIIWITFASDSDPSLLRYTRVVQGQVGLFFVPRKSGHQQNKTLLWKVGGNTAWQVAICPITTRYYYKMASDLATRIVEQRRIIKFIVKEKVEST
jgi:hypothetical protein